MGYFCNPIKGFNVILCPHSSSSSSSSSIFDYVVASVSGIISSGKPFSLALFLRAS